MKDTETTLTKLWALKALGIQLAIDDFGTGYSSLAYLRRFPVDTLKVDRSFVEKLGHDPLDTAIVQSVLELAKTLHLSVTARRESRHASRNLICKRSAVIVDRGICLPGRCLAPGFRRSSVARPRPSNDQPPPESARTNDRLADFARKRVCAGCGRARTRSPGDRALSHTGSQPAR